MPGTNALSIGEDPASIAAASPQTLPARPADYEVAVPMGDATTYATRLYLSAENHAVSFSVGAEASVAAAAHTTSLVAEATRYHHERAAAPQRRTKSASWAPNDEVKSCVSSVGTDSNQTQVQYPKSRIPHPASPIRNHSFRIFAASRVP